MAFNILAGTQYVQQQGEEGRQRGQGQFAAKLLGEAYNSTGAARQDALGRLAGRQPQVAMAADQQFRQQDAQMTEEAFARLQTHAKMIQSVPAEQRANVWAQIQPRIAQELPEYAQYLPSQWDEASVMPVVEQLASLGGDDSQLPSSVREAQAFRADPSLLETRRQMYGSYSYGEVPMPDGTVAQRRANSRTGKMELVLANGTVIPIAGETDTGGGMLGQPAPASAPPPPPRQPPTRVFSIEGETGAAGPEETAALEAAMTQGGTFIIGPDGRPQRAGAPGVDLTMRQPTQQPAVNRPLPSINDIGGGPLPPMRGSGRGGIGFGLTTDQQAAAKASEAGRTEAARIAAQQAAAEQQLAIDSRRESALATAKAEAERAAKGDVKESNAGDVLTLLDEAEPLIRASTNGMVANAGDTLRGAFGQATPGAQAIAQLKAIGGQLTAKQPRMEGPQSNVDVQMYREMAGDLANPNIPVASRLAAARTIRRLQQEYAPGGPKYTPPQGGQQQTGQTNVIKYDAQGNRI